MIWRKTFSDQYFSIFNNFKIFNALKYITKNEMRIHPKLWQLTSSAKSHSKARQNFYKYLSRGVKKSGSCKISGSVAVIRLLKPLKNRESEYSPK